MNSWIRLVYRLVASALPHFIYKVLTYVEYRAVPGVFQNNIDPPPTPLSTQRVCPPPASKAGGGGTHSPGREGVGGATFWKALDIGLASYSLISLYDFIPCSLPPSLLLYLSILHYCLLSNMIFLFCTFFLSCQCFLKWLSTFDEAWLFFEGQLWQHFCTFTTRNYTINSQSSHSSQFKR